MSQALGLFTIAKALASAAEYLRQPRLDWRATNQDQKALLDLLPRLMEAFPLVPTLVGIARPTAQEINDWLAQKGFDLALQPWPADGNTFGMASPNDFTVEWPVVGETKGDDGRPITILGEPAFRLSQSNGLEFWSASVVKEPIIRMPTENGDVMYLVKHAPLACGWEVTQVILRIRKVMGKYSSGYSGADIPMVELDLRPDISWILGLKCKVGSDEWRISQAIQQLKFAMNQHGARVIEGTVMSVSRSPERFYQLDGPFLIWIERPGVEFPLLTAQVTVDDFRDPGDLSWL